MVIQYDKHQDSCSVQTKHCKCIIVCNTDATTFLITLRRHAADERYATRTAHQCTAENYIAEHVNNVTVGFSIC